MELSLSFHYQILKFYKHNYEYMFTSETNTWHVMEMKKIVKESRCIQVNYVTFETDWKVE